MSVTAKVSRHIPDISPTLTLRKDKAYTTYPSNRKRYALPRMEIINEIEPNYAWNKLPNMSAYKTAIVRNKVCEGLMYLLPGDKNSTSLARPYTAELGAIFQEPYHQFKPNEYNDENVKQSSRVHFSPNTHVTRLTNERQVARNPRDLNSVCKKSYNDYNTLVLKSEESKESAGGKGNLPISVKVGQAEIDLQKEVDKILDDVGVNDVLETEEETVFPATGPPTDRTAIAPNQSFNSSIERKSSVRFFNNQKQVTKNSLSPVDKVRDFRGHNYHKKSAGFRDYKQLREAEVPRPQLPTELKSQYLSSQKSDEIWNWLHWDYKKSKFEHFVEVCS